MKYVVVSKLCLEWSMENHTKSSKKIPHIPIPIICHWDKYVIINHTKDFK